MPKRKADADGNSPASAIEKSPSLKQLADRLGLAPATVSLVLNGALVAETISSETKAEIFRTARELNYRPNFFARCLRTRRSFTIGVMVPEVSNGYTATVLSGIEDELLQQGYFYFVASHRYQMDLIDEYAELFIHRSVDGLIAVSTPWKRSLPVPTVTISSHHEIEGASRIVLDHDRAARLALGHLRQLGHRNIAFIKGQSFVPDTDVRWAAISRIATEMNLPVCEKLVGQIHDNSPSAEPGYRLTREFIASGEPFTALFAFNDISAMGAIRALTEAGMRVPEDVSVIGFDDIESAAYQKPGLTTVRQPLRKMGQLAAENVLHKIVQSGDEASVPPSEIIIEPELIIRATTAVPPMQTPKIATNRAKPPAFAHLKPV